ncbi:phage terminase large subunit [Paraburkholderia sp. Ac-20342]|uniref:phage terminase large subunit n=1 Tax=Paraburkholderia sp. Ac-20342 TaxID=2703889 RepID=UPI00197F6AEA|nr:phage terminase large subunit [Paraburkholderia sp. Ac-20342]MBN3848637.1 phage terminase large subunit [Paraburkholderia sp. Ac-20342]
MKSRSQTPSPSSKTITEVDPELLRATAKAKCERSHLFFSRYFFKHRQAIKFRINWHHELIAEKVQAVIDGRIKNLVINVPPGSSKTELVAINLMARGLALNPRARFLHISYSDDLALLNSQTARELVQSDEFQELWPLEIADDAKSKKRWNVLVNGKKAGGVYAVSLGGQITGFRAGHMAEGWQGAIIIDDPLKVDDADSTLARKKANRRLLSTVKSRKANPDTPIIVIMQRLAADDPTGFIKGGNLPGEWDFVSIPALIDDAYVETLPDALQSQVDRDDCDKDGRFSYWPYKEPVDDLLEMEEGRGTDSDGGRVSRYVFASQYQQSPKVLGGDIIKGADFRRYKVLPQLRYRKIYADTAQKTAERNDYSVFECWGFGYDGNAYLLDLIRGKWPAPELKRRAIDFWNKHNAIGAGDPNMPVLRQMKVEDKASGTGLIQDIQAEGGIPIEGIERTKDKLTRVMDVVSFIEAGLVYLPESADWVLDFISECESFTADDTHAHDDQVDPMVDAIVDMLGGARDLSVWERLAG